jgi:polar amino acid transport system substrate-binding protein
MTHALRLNRLALVAATAAAVFASIGTAHARPLDAIRKSGTILIATEGKFPPFNFMQGQKPAGFEMDIAEAVAKKMGLKIEWKILGFDALLVGLSQDRFDEVIASHGITEERSKAVLFANPHYCTGGVVVAKDPKINSGKDLADKVVAVQVGTTYLDNVKKLPGVKEVKSFTQDNDARAALQTGHVDAWVSDKFVAKASLDATPGSGLHLGDFIFVERVAAAVGHDNAPLAAEINKALAAIQADGTYAAISQKWFHEDIRCK